MNTEAIKKNVIDNLYWDVRIDASNVKVEVDDDGQVTLKGTVPSYSAKTAASTNTWTVNGVTRVVNNLTIEYPTMVTIQSDSDIKENIENSLLWSTDVDSTKINILVDNNEVTLEGAVDAFWKKYRAETLADITGVYSINNKLAVVPSEDKTDEDIAKNVMDAIERNMNIDIDDVEVTVNNARVTLTGEVDSWYAYRSAEESAFFTLGVKDVDNLIKIEY